jgi:hypothetical protein
MRNNCSKGVANPSDRTGMKQKAPGELSPGAFPGPFPGHLPADPALADKDTDLADMRFRNECFLCLGEIAKVVNLRDQRTNFTLFDIFHQIGENAIFLMGAAIKC